MKRKFFLLPVMAFALSVCISLIDAESPDLFISSAYANGEVEDDEREVDITMDCSGGIGSPKFKSGVGCLKGDTDCTPVHPCD